MYKSLSKSLIISSLMLSLSLYLMACTGGTGIRHLPPISPTASFKITEQSLENLKSENVPDDVLEKSQSLKNQEFTGEEQFLDVLKRTVGDEQTVRFKSLILKHASETLVDLKPKDDPKHAMTTISKEDVVITAQYWRGYDLDFQFNRGNMKSPFYYEGAWHQSEKVDVFWVTIENKRKNPIVFNVKKCDIIDNREDEYQALSYDENVKRLLYKAGRTKDIDNGLKKSREILLEMQAPTGEIPPGKKIEGYIPFYQLKRLAESLTVTIPIELAPPKGTIERYKMVNFNFVFAHSPTIRDAQPATIKF